MKTQGFENLQSFRGKMDKENSEDPYAYERAQYVKILLESANSTGKNPLL
jgi:dihydroorotate dehydrogenase (fumarate)